MSILDSFSSHQKPSKTVQFESLPNDPRTFPKNKAKILSRSVNIGQAIRNCLEIIDHFINKNSYLHTTFCKRIFDCWKKFKQKNHCIVPRRSYFSQLLCSQFFTWNKEKPWDSARGFIHAIRMLNSTLDFEHMYSLKPWCANNTISKSLLLKFYSTLKWLYPVWLRYIFQFILLVKSCLFSENYIVTKSMIWW